MKKLLVALILLLVACGKRGDPHPPVPIIPKATTDLLVTQRGSGVILAWSFPSLTTAGKALHEIRRVIVYRAIEELPVPQGGRDPNTMQPGDVDPTVPRPIALFSKIPAMTPKQFAKLRERIDVMEKSSLPAATAGAKLTYEDSPQYQTTDGRPVRLTYAVVTEGEAARSDYSNLVSIVPITVPAAPVSLAAAAKPKGIELTWSEPAAANGEKLALVGYNIYRSPAKQEAGELDAPVNAAPVAQTNYTDVPAYGDYTYVVRAVSSIGPPRIEGDPSAPITATFKDLMPPPAPASVNALIETHAVRLVWDAVEAPDLAGYKVYRTEGVGHLDEPGGIRVAGSFNLVPLIQATQYVDPAADLGIAYRYGISAVDKNGNESEKIWTPWVTVPKTP